MQQIGSQVFLYRNCTHIGLPEPRFIECQMWTPELSTPPPNHDLWPTPYHSPAAPEFGHHLLVTRVRAPPARHQSSGTTSSSPEFGHHQLFDELWVLDAGRLWGRHHGQHLLHLLLAEVFALLCQDVNQLVLRQRIPLFLLLLPLGAGPGLLLRCAVVGQHLSWRNSLLRNIRFKPFFKLNLLGNWYD